MSDPIQPTDSTALDEAAAAPTPTPAEAPPKHPWIAQLNLGKSAMAARVAQGDPLAFRVAEFWSESSWPLHTIEADESLAKPSGDFLERLAKQGLTPALNVIVHHKSNHHVGSTFGPHAFNMSFDYAKVESMRLAYEEASASGKLPVKPADEAPKTRAQKELLSAAAGADIDLKDTPAGAPKDKFAYLDYLGKRVYPTPAPVVEPEAWESVGGQSKLLCEKFGLRAVSVPLAFTASESERFIARLDGALSQLAEFMGVEPALLGLDKWLGLRARAPGANPSEETLQLEGSMALAEKEKEAAKKKKNDSEHGMFMGNFIQIEVSPNFEPVVLAHEWFHSLDLWFGSREIVAKQPWRGWSVFASQVAFSDYDQSEKLKAWRRQLADGGESKPEFLSPLPQHDFLSQMRFDKDQFPEGEFYMGVGDLLARRFMRAFGDIPMTPEHKASTEEQSLKLGNMIAEAALVHGVDHIDSALCEDSLARHRKDFFVEWGDLACMWAQRQAPGAEPSALADVEAKLRAETLRVLSGAWNWASMERTFPSPDVHTLQAMRMDALHGGLGPYFSTPHEMLAYKLEELFLSHGKELRSDDKVGSCLLSWLRDEAVPALREAREVSFQSVMGSKKKPAP